MVEISESTFSLTGRVVDARGAGLDALRVVVVATTANDRTAMASGATGTDGTFSLPVSQPDALAMFRREGDQGEAWSAESTIELTIVGKSGRIHREQRRIRIDDLLGTPSLGEIVVASTTTAASYGLRVRVVTSSSRPVSEATVVVRDARRGATATLGTGRTDARGEVTVLYAGGSGASATMSGQHVRVEVRDGTTVLGRSAVLFSPADDEWIDLVVRDDRYRGPSEFERIALALQPILGSTPASTLAADDLEDVAHQADVAPSPLADYIRAIRLARPGIDAPWFYALLRDGLPASLPALLAAGAPRWRRALTRALDGQLVPQPTGNRDVVIDAVIAALRGAAAEALLQTTSEGDARLPTAIAASGVSATARLRFAQAWVAHSGDIDAFWSHLRTAADLPRAEVDTLEFAVHAATTVGHHRPALDALVGLRARGELPHLREIAGWDAARWRSFVADVGAPLHLPGASAPEREANYAATLERASEELFPTAYLAHRFGRDTVPGTSAAAAFLRRNEDFDLVGTIVQKYVEERPGSVGTGPDAATAVDELKRVQRVYNLAPRMHRAAITSTLLRRGIASAAQIVRMGFDGFVDTHAAALEGSHPTLSGRQVAATIFERATQRNAFSVALMGQFGASFNAISMGGVPQHEFPADGPGMATLRELFGSLDYCACEHCRSVFGPAAYFVDLLALLESRPSLDPTDNALDVLRSRRPDLTGIELSCANTNTVLPYLDLVLEVLESVATDPASPLVPRQTRRSAAELRIAAEHHLASAYDVLESDVYPWTLPFSLPTERLRILMRQLGVTRERAMETFTLDPRAPMASERIAEALAMTRRELQLVSGATAFPLDEFPAVPTQAAWGMTGVAQWTTQLAEDVATTLDHAGSSYDEMLALFELEFINPLASATPVRVFFEEPSCDLADARLENLTPAVLDRWHRFVRLWRKRGGTMRELDRCVRVLGSGVLDRACLAELVAADAVAARLGGRLDDLHVLWRPLDTRGYPQELSPYHRLFANREVTPTLDVAFAIPNGGNDVVGPAVPLAAHLDTLRAALRLGAEDLEFLIDATLGPSPQVNRANLSTLTRHVTLARALGLRVQELLQVRAWVGGALDPFASPSATASFADEVERIRRSGIEPDALDYLLRHRFAPETGLHPTATDVETLLASVVDAARRLEEVLSAVTGEPATQVTAHLSTIFADAAVVREFGRILGLTVALSADENAFVATHLPMFVEATDLAGAREAFSSAATPQARIDLVLGWLVTHRRRVGRREALMQLLAAATGLAASAVRVLVDEVLHRGGLPLAEVLLAEGFLSTGIDTALQRDAIVLLRKASLLVGGLGIATEDLRWYFTTPAAPQSMDLDALPLAPIDDGSPHYAQWRRMVAGLGLREALRTPQNAYAEVTGAASIPAAVDALADATGWDRDTVAFAVGDGLLGLSQPADVAQLADPFALERVARVADLVRRTGTRAAVLAQWAQEQPSAARADAAMSALRSRYAEDVWPAVITPLVDALRVRQRDALLAHILVNSPFRSTTELYAHYLIDPEMEANTLTSRIRLATSAVQLFIMRVLMNLESQSVVFPRSMAERWTWMKLYRVWEANRRVFFYPENWIEPELRDDKSPFFRELEQHLNQGEIDDAHAEDGYKAYLRKLHEVAHLETLGIYVERNAEDGAARETVHVLSRTRGLPHRYFYRRRIDDLYWTAWEPVPVDVQGDQVTLVTYNRRLFVFWLELAPESAPAPSKKATSMNDAVKSTPRPAKRYHTRVGWTELRDGNWAPKKLTARSDGYFKASGEIPTEGFTIVAWREEADAEEETPVRLHVDAVARNIAARATGTPRPAVTFAGFVYDDCRDDLEEEPTARLAQFTNGDLGIGKDVNVRGQFHRSNGVDEAFDVLTYHPELTGAVFDPDDNTDNSGYVSRALLENLPHTYRVTAARQRRLYLGDTPLVFDDADHAMYVAPVVELRVYTPQGDVVPGGAVLRAPVKVAARAGSAAWWDRLALLPVAETAAAAARAGQPAVAPASMVSTAPWGGRVPGRTFAPLASVVERADDTPDPALAEDSLAVARGTHLASTAFQLQSAGNPSLLDQTVLLQRMWRIDPFHHPHTCGLLAILNRHGVEGLFTKTDRQLASRVVISHGDEAMPGRPYRPTDRVSLPDTVDDYDFTFGGAYSVYNWELFFHAPMWIAQRLRGEGRFAEAQRWYHFLFDPTAVAETSAEGIPLEGPERFWNIKPLFDEMAHGPLDVIRTIFGDEGLQTSPEVAKDFFDSIAQWVRNPFSPHAIARVRMGTYQKFVVRKYLDNLIEWADSLFRADTIESINEATQLYLLAASILGPKPRQISEITTPVRTYDELAFTQLFGGLTELEGFYPPELPPHDGGGMDDPHPPTPPVWWYFCLPPNDKLLAYWDTVGDRLFKIRHSQNIDGVERQLALFEPPIDPALLVRAFAAGVDIGAALSDLHAPLPHYRYGVLYAKAVDLTADVRSLGAALLSAMEKRDGERLSLLRSQHEIAVLQGVLDVRKAQVREAEEAIVALERQRDTVEARQEFYLTRKKVSSLESKAEKLLLSATILDGVSAGLKGLAGVLGLIPNIDGGVLAIIPMLKVIFGGDNLAVSATAAGDVVGIAAAAVRYESQATSTSAGYERRFEDWQFQGKQAGLELAALDKQIIGAQIRLAIATKELANHQRQIAQSQQVDAFMRSKFTNAELYDWMVAQISAVYFQSYKLAYDMAKKAERALQFELGREDLAFIAFGAWDSLKKGLMAGERLNHSLKRLDGAQIEHNRREHELTKRVSLRQIDPRALLTLQETGACTFEVGELLFDLDHPGHYFRRLKSVGLSIDATVDAHTSPGATLSLVRDTLRVTASSPGGAGGYPRDAEAPQDDTRFRDGVGGVQSIATSRGRDDAGLFELSFRDERYLPFEGAGAISTWRLELPAVAQFDYRSIGDVELQLSYTARDGGAPLRSAASSWVEARIAEVVDAANQTGLLLLQSAQKDFATGWERFLRPVEGQQGAPLPIPIVLAKFPFIARSRSVVVDAVELVFVTEGATALLLPTAAQPSTLTVPSGEARALTYAVDGPLVRGTVSMPGPVPLSTTASPWAWSFGDGAVVDPARVLDLLVVVRYHIGDAPS